MGFFWQKKNKINEESSEKFSEKSSESEADNLSANVSDNYADESSKVSDESSEAADESSKASDGSPKASDEASEDADKFSEAVDESSQIDDASEKSGNESEKMGFFARLKAGLSKTRDKFVASLNSVFTSNEIDEDFYEEIEEILIMGDIGVATTESIIDNLKAQVKEKHLKKTEECRQILIDSIKQQMQVAETEYLFEKELSIVMVIGVNGVGKTTTVGKLAGKLKKQGRNVLIAAADTFRAAAGEQLEIWAKRADVPIVGSVNGADPASVVFDAVSAAKARNVDVLLIDTAGRLHNKKNLMEELRKMDKIISREYPTAHRENLIVLDGTTGQNALIQAKEFSEVAPLTGIVLTKMDGTAKGGIAVAISSELGIPVKYIGVGESIEDLQKFDSNAFVDALFDEK